MKKLAVGLLTFGVILSIAGCGSTKETTTKTSSSVEQSTEDSSAKEAKKMKKIEEKLQDAGVSVSHYTNHVYLDREKGIDYDYFEMTVTFDSSASEILDIRLTLKGNIDGEKKDVLVYKVVNNRIVEYNGSNTDITRMSEILKSLDISDQELVEFVQWYYQENNK